MGEGEPAPAPAAPAPVIKIFISGNSGSKEVCNGFPKCLSWSLHFWHLARFLRLTTNILKNQLFYCLKT